MFGFYEVTDSELFKDGTREIVYLCDSCRSEQNSRFKLDWVFLDEETDRCDICGSVNDIGFNLNDWVYGDRDRVILGLIDRSILRWSGIVYDNRDSEESDCPLCNVFSFSDCSDGNDVLCPIALMTGASGCWETPYYSFTYWTPEDSEYWVEANRMLVFLYEVRLWWVRRMISNR